MRIDPYIETVQDRRRRIELESAIKRRYRVRYRIQINLKGPHDGRIFPACSLPFVCSTKNEAWAYMEKVNPMKFFPNARSASVEFVGY
jgi:hypothetical protein